MGLVPYLPDGCMGKTVADNIIYSEQIANATSGATTIVLYCLSMRSVHNEVDILLWVTRSHHGGCLAIAQRFRVSVRVHL